MRALIAWALCGVMVAVVYAEKSSAQSADRSEHSAQADSKAITFDGVRYFLADVKVAGKTITDEYVPEGQSLTNWTTLMAVRRFGSASELKEVLPVYMRTIQPVLAGKPYFLKRNGVDPSQEVMLVLLLVAPDKTYHEYNLHRFFRTPDGVTAYQFAQRIPRTGDPSAIDPVLKRQADRIKSLNEITLPVLTSQ